MEIVEDKMLKFKYFLLNDLVQEIECFDESLLKDGKCLYEVIKVKEGIPLFLERHIKRLHNSAKLTNLNLWVDDKYVEKALYKLISENEVHEGSLKFVLNFDKKTFIAFFEEVTFPSEKDFNEGVSIWTYKRERDNPNAKVLNMDFRADLDKFMKEKNIFEALLVDRNGYITEGSKSNVFIVMDNKIITTPVKAVLPGTKRGIVLEICKKADIVLEERNIEENELERVQGIFLTSTPFDVLPVKEVDGFKILSGENPLIKNVMYLYSEMVVNYINSKSIS